MVPLPIQRKRYSGFTLIELVIVMSVISVLITIAYPHYSQYVTRARRMDGQTALVDLAAKMELFYSEKRTYKTATIGTGRPTDVQLSRSSSGGIYLLNIAQQTSNAYLLQAIPQKAQAIHDSLCQTLTFDHLGNKGITTGPKTPLGRVIDCW